MDKHEWDTEWQGLEHIPRDGGALLVANHAAAIPSDAPVIMHGIEKELGRPVYDLLGGKVRERLRSYTYLYSTGPDDPVYTDPDTGKQEPYTSRLSGQVDWVYESGTWRIIYERQAAMAMVLAALRKN